MKRWGILAAAAILAACGRPDAGGRSQAMKTAAPTVEPAPHTVASILASPPPAGTKLTLNAYAGIAGNPALGGCPGKTNSQLLTDRMIPQVEPHIGGFSSRDLTGKDYPADRPWLIASSEDGLPAHARLEGHMGDERYRHCPEFARIFVVDAVLVEHQAYAPSMGGLGRIPTIPLPAGFDDWPELDEGFGFSVSYPPQATIETVASALPFERRIHFNDEIGTIVEVRVREGEVPYDPFDLSVGGDVFQGYPQLFGKSSLMFMGGSLDLPEDEILGYETRGETGPNAYRASAFFVGGGRTYEFSAEFRKGYDLSWEGLHFFHALLYSYEGPGLRRGDPTPTSAIKREVVGAGFLSQDEVMELARRDFGAGVSLIEAEIVSEERARGLPGVECNAIQGHPDGVWLATLAGALRAAPNPLIAAYDARSGELYCSHAVGSPFTPTPTAVIPTPTPSPAPPTTDPYLPPVPTPYPGPRRAGPPLTPTP